ncbi:RICIN domain-containing protein [Streptomyces sp. NPDC056160]|uniref:RICIN domain-containing protein n=1 Tax=Streptomyces sp. NPDC056160 TaxID=3345731 RepID=UPI0035E36E97
MTSLTRLTGALLAALACVTVSASATQAAVDGSVSGPLSIRNLKSGKCLSVPAASKDFAYLNQFTCGSPFVWPDQVWTYESVGQANGLTWYKVVNRNSGLCLSVDAASRDDFAGVTQYPCGSPALYPDQYWTFLYDPARRMDQIKNRNSGKCLAIQDGDTSDTAAAIQYQCGTWEDHYWHFGSI